MKSEAELQIRKIKKPDGSNWVAVLFIEITGLFKHRWVPSFRQLAEIVQEIAKIEEEKYPQMDRHKGWRLVADYFRRAANPKQDLDDLDCEFKIPGRETRIPAKRY